MPRDEVDGIKTKRGRVVYNRKPNTWLCSDVRRVINAFASSVVYESDPGKNFDCLLISSSKLFETLFIATASAGTAVVLMRQVEGWSERVYNLLSTDEKTEFGGGDAGGAGATREF